jgi:protease-4
MRHHFIPIPVALPAFSLTLLFLVLAGALPARAQPRLQGPIRPQLARGGFLATADGPAVALSLPAALAYVDVTRSLFAAEMVDDQFAGGLVLWQPRRFALGYRHVDRRPETSDHFNEDLYFLAFSRRKGPRAAGIDVTWLKNDVGGTADALSFGLSSSVRPYDALSLAYRTENLNRPHYLNGRLERVNAIGIAMRPFGRRVTFATDILFREDGADDFAIRYGFEAEPVDGLHLAAEVDNESGFGLSIALRGRENQAGYGIGGSSNGGPRHHFIHLGHEDRPARSRIDRGHRTGKLRVSGYLRDEDEDGWLVWGPRHRRHDRVSTALSRLAEDPGFEGLVLEVGPVRGRAALGAIRRQLLELRELDKRVVAYVDGNLGFSELFLASAADRIVAPPSAFGGLHGVAAYQNFYRGLLDRIGISVERFPCRTCIYKNAFSDLADSTLSAPEREETRILVNAIYDHYIAAISSGRGLEPRSLRSIADGRLMTAEKARELELVDELGFAADADTLLAELLGRRPAATQHLRPAEPRPVEWAPPPRVAVVIAQGTILPGRDRSTPWVGNVLGASDLARRLARAASDRSVKSVVLRGDSPGGSMAASDLVAAELERLVARKPVIASMGAVAASGGYYIAAPATRIVAEPLSITGSIGVTYLRADAVGLMEKAGIRQEGEKQGDHVDLFRLGRKLTSDEREMILDLIDAGYERFVEHVARSREFEREEIEALARGRVWTGEQAVMNGLADELGGLERALELAAAEAGIGDSYEVITFRREKPSLAARLFAALRPQAGSEPMALDTQSLLGGELWDQPLYLMDMRHPPGLD